METFVVRRICLTKRPSLGELIAARNRQSKEQTNDYDPN